ncbi:MAG: class I SAM-dependent methyltransferase [Syntrophobacteraceae bacterium]|nr:class I SAM-dependent methyltransferase [Syntrophobacteraceae bacterium]
MKRLKQVGKRMLPSGIIDILYRIKYRNEALTSANVYIDALRGKSGVEIGGPSATIFNFILPIYEAISHLDGVNFSTSTMWEGKISEDSKYNYCRKKCGRQYITETTDLSIFDTNRYDFVVSSNCLEHVANPLKALVEWVRVVKPGGYILLVLPNKTSNFDNKRSITSFSHILKDFENEITEYDLTHMDEILRLHDLSEDPPARNLNNFKVRCLDNFQNRGMHHHVFDMQLIERMFDYLNILLEQSDTTNRDFYALGNIVK